MPFHPQRAEIRFGCGLAPQHGKRLAPPDSVDAMMDRLTGPDAVAALLPIPPMAAYLPQLALLQQSRKARRLAKDTDGEDAARKIYRRQVRSARRDAAGWTGQMLMRRALTHDGLRERLAAFWADHFTARGTGGIWLGAQHPYIETAIRPYLTSTFTQMLRAVAMQPLMLHYLDQSNSVGPNSARARKKGVGGLNENLAREMLELHTLGVGGPYGQQDVQALARLLTGLSFDLKQGFRYRSSLAEPGPHILLGQSFGGATPELGHITAALDMLARHPATGAHLARKMAIHFLGDAPDPDLTHAMAAQFSRTGGNLAAMTRAMLDHPAAWADGLGNVRRPVDFIGAALRALDLVPRHMPGGDLKKMRALFLVPMELMGQPLEAPPGPDGWPEADADWITPQRLAARLGWAMSVPFQLRRTLPDPQDFAKTALGSALPEQLRHAAASAETRAEGIGLVLASPAFQRV